MPRGKDKIPDEILGEELVLHRPAPLQWLYLGHPIWGMLRYIIGSPACQSSGDIYHVLVYLALCRAQECSLPNVLIQFDTADTEIHALRSKGFADHLGFAAQVQLDRQTPVRCSNPTPRRLANLVTQVCQRSRAALLDQKVTTTLICHHLDEQGFARTTEQISHQFALEVGRNGVTEEMNTWITDQIQAAVGRAAGRPIVVLNWRNTGQANDKHDLSYQEVKALKELCDRLHLSLWILVIDSKKWDGNRYKKLGISDDFDWYQAHLFPNMTFVFNTAIDLDKLRTKREGTLKFMVEEQRDRVGDYKIRHLLLLQRMKALGPRLLCVVGNTSGTLDMAAFLGHTVFNFHQFDEEDKEETHLKIQDVRLLMQYRFMAIAKMGDRESFVIWFYGLLNRYLNDEPRGNYIQSVARPLTIGAAAGAAEVAHQDRRALAGYLVCRPEGEEVPADVEIHSLSIASAPYLVVFPWFQPMIDRLRTLLQEANGERETPREVRIQKAIRRLTKSGYFASRARAAVMPLVAVTQPPERPNGVDSVTVGIRHLLLAPPVATDVHRAAPVHAAAAAIADPVQERRLRLLNILERRLAGEEGYTIERGVGNIWYIREEGRTEAQLQVNMEERRITFFRNNEDIDLQAEERHLRLFNGGSTASPGMGM